MCHNCKNVLFHHRRVLMRFLEFLPTVPALGFDLASLLVWGAVGIIGAIGVVVLAKVLDAIN